MGNLIHVQIKHEIKYGDCGFNWQIDELEELLKDNGCDIYGSLNDDSVGDWEIPDEQFVNAVNKIEKKDAREIKEYFDPDFTGKESEEEVKKYVVTTLRRFAETGDHRNGYYHFSWY